jgi:hypothetical protein
MNVLIEHHRPARPHPCPSPGIGAHSLPILGEGPGGEGEQR